MSKRISIVRQLVLFTSVLCVALMLCEKSSAFDGEISLDKMSSMHYSGPVPELGGLSQANQIDLVAPNGSDYHNTAYRNTNGCVIFFISMSKVLHDLTFSWRGETCNGKPVSGAGELQAQYKVDTSTGTKTYVRIFSGDFADGLLSGQGKKVNLQFDAQGKLQEDNCEFSGQFAYGLLDGLGTKICYGPASAQQSLKVIRGDFKNGDTAEGVSVVSILHPYPGAEAISQQVLFTDKGGEIFYTNQAYVNKKALSGKIWFPGMDEAWDTAIYSLGDSYRLMDAEFQRKVADFPLPRVMTRCDGWQSGADGWRCEVENKIKYLYANNGKIGSKSDSVASTSSFILDMESINKTIPFRFISDRTPAETGWGAGFWFVHFLKGDKEPAHSLCNTSITSCEYSELKQVGGGLQEVRWRLFRDSRVWKNDKWQDLSGSTADATESGNEVFVDSRCSQYSSSESSTCLSGEVYFRNGGKWHGKYTLMYSGGYPVPGGYGRVTFADGRWAEGSKGTKGEAGTESFGSEWVSLSNCGDENGGIDCDLDGQTVVFHSR